MAAKPNANRSTHAVDDESPWDLSSDTQRSDSHHADHDTWERSLRRMQTRFETGGFKEGVADVTDSSMEAGFAVGFTQAATKSVNLGQFLGVLTTVCLVAASSRDISVLVQPDAPHDNTQQPVSNEQTQSASFPPASSPPSADTTRAPTVLSDDQYNRLCALRDELQRKLSCTDPNNLLVRVLHEEEAEAHASTTSPSSSSSTTASTSSSCSLSARDQLRDLESRCVHALRDVGLENILALDYAPVKQQDEKEQRKENEADQSAASRRTE